MANANASVSPSSVKKILLSTFGALVVAVALLFGAILPAEYGLDPLGTGSLLGLNALGQEQPISTQPGEYRVDSGELSLYPAEWVEYFYRLDEEPLPIIAGADGMVTSLAWGARVVQGQTLLNVGTLIE